MKKWFDTYKEKCKQAEKGQRGSIIIEASLILPFFIFTILIILSIVDICYVQAKVAVAVNSASKEMSQYAYLYHTLNLDKYLDNGEGGTSSELLGGFSKLLSYASDGTAEFSEDISAMFSTAENAALNDSLGKTAKDQLIGGGLAKQLVQKNLVAFDGDTADAFLKRCRVVDGLDGLNFVYTSFLNDPNHDLVDIVVTYKVKVIELLGFDYKFTFVQRAQSGAWGKGGASSFLESNGGPSNGTEGDNVEQETSLWDYGPVVRGQEIIKEEKKNFDYTSDKGGFHAYDPDNNEFVKIISVETDATSASAEQTYRNAIVKAYGDIYDASYKAGDTVNVKDSSGKEVQFSKGEESNYRVVIVVPEGTDLQAVNDAARKYEEERAKFGEKLTVEVKTGYGSPSSESTNNTNVAE